MFVHFGIDKGFDFCLIVFLEIDFNLLFFPFFWSRVIDIQNTRFDAGAPVAFSKTLVAGPGNEPRKPAG